MSIVKELNSGWHLDHETFINDIVDDLDLRSKPFFEIMVPFRMDLEAARVAREMTNAAPPGKVTSAMRKREKKRNSRRAKKLEPHEERLESHRRNLFSELAHARLTPELVGDNNSKVRRLVAEIPGFEHPAPGDKLISFSNESDEAKRLQLSGKSFIIPARSRLLLGDIAESIPLLVAERVKFEVIVMDPPWENKHVRRELERGNGYAMETNDALFEKLKIPELLNRENGHLFIWCTNTPRHQEAVRNWIDLWGLELRSTWYWLKVTKTGETVCAMESVHKKPYEVIFLASSKGNEVEAGFLRKEQLISSVPSGVQSVKPPLCQILSKIIPKFESMHCLEIFGRNLLPNWTTVGNECLRFQDTFYFVEK